MNILLVEDNESIINGLVYAFDKNGYHLDCPNDIKTTLKYLNENNP